MNAYGASIEEENRVRNHKVLPNLEEDILKIVIFERPQSSGNRGFGFINGFGFKEGAVASTVAHDC